MKNQEDKSANENKELMNLILGRKGGETTIKIIDQLLQHPYNINQLSKKLGLNYKTIKYHIQLILKSNFITQDEISYGSLYYPTQKLKKNLKEYEQIKEHINNR